MMQKIKIAFGGSAYDFTYYNSWMDSGHHLFYVITDNSEAISILHLDHFFINVIKNTPEEVEFKDVIAREIIEHHYQSRPVTHLN